MEVILDTNILIEILKNNEETIELVQKFNTHYISVISAMELYYGAFNKTELNKLKKFVELFNIININEEISDLSKKLVFDYAKSHSLDIPDSLIAATAKSIKRKSISMSDLIKVKKCLFLTMCLRTDC